MTNVCIVGANRGIGLALARQYVSRGVEVIAACRRSSPELNELKIRVIDEINVTDARSVRRLAHQLNDEKLGLLIHNAGILLRDTFNDFDQNGDGLIAGREFRKGFIASWIDDTISNKQLNKAFKAFDNN